MKKDSKNNSANALKFLFSYIFKYKFSFLAGLIFLIVVDYLQLVIPKIIQKTLDSIANVTFSEKIILINSLYIILFAFVMVVLRFFWRLFIVGSSRKIEKEMRKELYEHLTGLSFSYFNKTKTGDLMALLINDLRVIRMAAGPALIGITDTLFLGIMTIVFMISINLRLTLISIIPLFIIGIFLITYGGKIQRQVTKLQEAFGDISSFSQEIFSGIKVVKGFHMEETEKQRFTEVCANYMSQDLKLAKTWGLLQPLIAFVSSLSIVIFLVLGGFFVIQKIITIGEYISFNFYIANLVWPMVAIGWVVNLMQQGIASTIRIKEVLDEKKEVEEIGKLEVLDEIKGDIEIRNLNFKYSESDKEILKNISIKIPAGTSLGIVGKPGAGKTTLISLLLRIFKVKDSTLFIDSNDINKINPFSLRGNIGYVPQDSFLFSDTIEENILLGIKENEINEQRSNAYNYSKAAVFNKDINKFKDKIKTKIGERGVTLSGGQRQRLSIARALIINPSILIFDDSFSSIDTQTEKEILTNIRKEISNKTSIFIAHRVSTIRDCDNIIVLENGMITEQGTHDELVEFGGYYSRLFELQRLTEEIS